MKSGITYLIKASKKNLNEREERKEWRKTYDPTYQPRRSVFMSKVKDRRSRVMSMFVRPSPSSLYDPAMYRERSSMDDNYVSHTSDPFRDPTITPPIAELPATRPTSSNNPFRDSMLAESRATDVLWEQVQSTKETPREMRRSMAASTAAGSERSSRLSGWSRRSRATSVATSVATSADDKGKLAGWGERDSVLKVEPLKIPDKVHL